MPPVRTRAYDDPSKWPAFTNSTSTSGATGIGPVVPDRLQLRDRTERVRFRVERQSRRVLRISVAVGIRGVLFLNAAGVRQYDPAEVQGASRAEHASAKALRDEPRQVSAMVKMRVGQNDGVDLGRWNRKGLPVPFAQFLETLEETRINEDLG